MQPKTGCYTVVYNTLAPQNVFLDSFWILDLCSVNWEWGAR
jgi:hypothetical protein